MVLRNLFGGNNRRNRNSNSNNRRNSNANRNANRNANSNSNSNSNNKNGKMGGNPEWVLPAALLLGQKMYHSSSNAHIGNRRHKKTKRKSGRRKSRTNFKKGKSRRR